jgi:hypothetical protein
MPRKAGGAVAFANFFLPFEPGPRTKRAQAVTAEPRPGLRGWK